MVFAICSNTKAQEFVLLQSEQKSDNIQIIKDNAEYNTLLTYYSTYPNFQITSSIVFDGDTLIADIEYKKTYQKFSSSPNGQSMEYELIGYMREEESGEIYYRPSGSDNDYLLYDFGLAVNDSTLMYWNQHDWGGVYVRVDSIIPKYVGGMTRNCYYISSRDDDSYNWSWYNTWIEGIGSMEGIMNSCQSQKIGKYNYPTLLCYTDNDELIYKNENYDACVIDGPITSVEEENGLLNVYFDASNSQLHLHDFSNSYRQVCIFNVLGNNNVVLKENCCDKIIDLSYLPVGIYVAVILADEQKITIKFIKSK